MAACDSRTAVTVALTVSMSFFTAAGSAICIPTVKATSAVLMRTSAGTDVRPVCGSQELCKLAQ